MLIIGLTGGIGSGKSAVAEEFARLGVPIIDADVIAREVVAPGTQGLAEVVARFGHSVLDGGGNLDRRRLREVVFADDGARHSLEALLHPRIRGEMARQAAVCRAPYCVLVIPLLLESGQSGQHDLVQRVLVVDVPESLQIARTCARDGIPETQVRAILAAQIGREERLRGADDIVVNDRDLAHIHREVARLHRFYLELAATV